MTWSDKLPDVSQWQPRTDKAPSLSAGLRLTCHAIQSRILNETDIEQRFAINNYDTGPGLEDIVRRELSQLLPDRYSIEAGVVNDRNGQTSGDHDVLILNRTWASPVKLGATSTSRRFHYPIESLYSAIEVKRTLGYQELDEAMSKLVTLSRLDRPTNPYGHITENQHFPVLDPHGSTLNPLHTIILATRLPHGISFQDLAMRFGLINCELSRQEMVRELCVLNEGVAMYMVDSEGSPSVEADFMRDTGEVLAMAIYDQEPENAFHILFVHTLGHLTRSVLRIHDLHRSYTDFRPTSNLIRWKTPRYNNYEDADL